MNNDLKTEYRDELGQARQSSQNAYDKSIISLSGGALAISLFFVRDLIGDKGPVSPDLLVWSWKAWAFSLMAVVASFYLSQMSFSKAIDQIDSGEKINRIGGWATRATHIANTLSGIFFVIGIIFFLNFASKNL